MSAYDEFYQMAKGMLEDPEIRSSATLKLVVMDAPVDKPWAAGPGQVTSYPVFCFYYKAKNSTVNGTVIQTGQKIALVQSPLPEASLRAALWEDANGKQWKIKTTEPVEVADKEVYTKVLLGA